MEFISSGVCPLVDVVDGLQLIVEHAVWVQDKVHGPRLT